MPPKRNDVGLEPPEWRGAKLQMNDSASRSEVPEAKGIKE
jgi:hypothetical protein